MRSVPWLTLFLLGAAPSVRADVGASRQPIINGHAVTLAEVHGTVALLDAQTLSPYCSGTLVSPRVVVTAAHCLYDEEGRRLPTSSIAVAFGLLDLESTPSAANVVALDRSEPHPGYARNPAGDERPNGLDPTEHDVALLVLDRDLTEITPVPMARASEATSALALGALVKLAGYGYSDDTLHPIGRLLETSAAIEDRTPNEFLAAPADPTQGDTCFGDSGGPAYAIVGEELRLVGVTSRGRADVQTDCGEGGIYTSAATYRRWVMETSGDPRVAPDLHGGGCGVVPSAASAWPLALALLLYGYGRARLSGSAARGSVRRRALRPARASARG